MNTDPFAPRDTLRLARLFDACPVDPVTGCRVWSGALTLGYGRVKAGKRIQLAHRVAYELFVGPIPSGLHLDHLCRNRACVNPEHLEPVSRRENILRGTGPTAANARKTHCVHGHSLDDAIAMNGSRVCRTCKNAARRARRATLARAA